MKRVKKTAVLGFGSWGTALATVVAHRSETVSLWGRNEKLAADINLRHENRRYLPGMPLSTKVAATTDIEEALCGADAVVVGLPTKALESVLKPLAGKIPAGVPVISTSKGICTETLRFPSRIIKEALGRSDKDIFILSGPSFAQETTNQLPTAVTFAGESLGPAAEWGHLFFTPTFRTYPSTDRVGVEVAGALKNVIWSSLARGDSAATGASVSS